MNRSVFFSGILALIAASAAAAAPGQGEEAPLRGAEIEGNEAVVPDAGGKVAMELKVVERDSSGKRRTTARVSADEAAARVIQAGEYVEVCFTPERSGFVTLWDYNAEGKVTLLYPNSFAPAPSGGKGMPVEAAKQTCVGTDQDAFKIRIRPPAGATRMHLRWTASDEDQFTAADYETLGRSTKAARTGGVDETEVDIRYTVK